MKVSKTCKIHSVVYVNLWGRAGDYRGIPGSVSRVLFPRPITARVFQISNNKYKLFTGIIVR